MYDKPETLGSLWVVDSHADPVPVSCRIQITEDDPPSSVGVFDDQLADTKRVGHLLSLRTGHCSEEDGEYSDRNQEHSQRSHLKFQPAYPRVIRVVFVRHVSSSRHVRKRGTKTQCPCVLKAYLKVGLYAIGHRLATVCYLQTVSSPGIWMGASSCRFFSFTAVQVM